MNWKLKISNTANNADITQSQERDTRHRRMQEVNSLCTGSGQLRAEYCIKAFHTIQPSSFCLLFVRHAFERCEFMLTTSPLNRLNTETVLILFGRGKLVIVHRTASVFFLRS